MFSLGSSHRYLLYGKPTDMRKSFDALCGIVRNELKRDPLCGEVFLFLNRGRTHLKLLHWESGGTGTLLQTAGTRHLCATPFRPAKHSP